MLTKRLTKFLLKRLLGKYIVCDLDLDQLDVELRSGLIHLKDIDLGIDVRIKCMLACLHDYQFCFTPYCTLIYIIIIYYQPAGH
jgi:hypothetical protein